MRTNNCVKELDNGNLVIEYDEETIALAEKDEIWTLSEVLSWVDTNFIGETFCISNFDTGHRLYNSYSDKVYTFYWSDLQKLKNGERVVLYAEEPDDDDRELIENEGY